MELLGVLAACLGGRNCVNADDLDLVGARLVAGSHVAVYETHKRESHMPSPKTNSTE